MYREPPARRIAVELVARENAKLRTAGVVGALERSAELFEQAIRLAPRCASAHAGLADELFSLTRRGRPPAEIFDRARAAARIARELDPGNAEAANALASALFWRDWKWQEAAHELARNPSYAEAHLMGGRSSGEVCWPLQTEGGGTMFNCLSC
ncbi:MAG: hypothetical protein ACRD44_18575 [Bryobacteraceae bacterium]